MRKRTTVIVGVGLATLGATLLGCVACTPAATSWQRSSTLEVQTIQADNDRNLWLVGSETVIEQGLDETGAPIEGEVRRDNTQFVALCRRKGKHLACTQMSVELTYGDVPGIMIDKTPEPVPAKPDNNDQPGTKAPSKKDESDERGVGSAKPE